ncbi:MAG: hypothetical protein K9M55_08120, partial [Candidatus Marinimicrobia bacterium]|nr:hypothetical protein [Candidatus Neomarinimicrobiota bacterium]
IGYSGTSGTEHPHLHFEIRDRLGQVHNPQVFYPGILDQKAPILEEVMLIPVGEDSRINGSLFPMVFDMQQEIKTVSVSGPFSVAFNAHDVANGTYNKYNIYHAQVLVNDSLVFEREFDQVALRLTDDVEKIYPGMQGKHGWRFMSMYNSDVKEEAPFSPTDLSGIISPAGLSELHIKVSDLAGNEVTKNFIFHEQVWGKWDIRTEENHYIMTRHFPEGGYENIQFYTGNNRYLQISETSYRLNSTSWVFDSHQDISSGVRAIGATGGKIKWIIPPQNQEHPELNFSWNRKGDGLVLQIEATEPYIFPLAYSLYVKNKQFSGELVQSSPTLVESDMIPLHHAALGDSIEFLFDEQVIASLPLDPMEPIPPGEDRQFTLDPVGAQLSAQNSGDSELYIKMDTTNAFFNNEPVMGINIELMHTPGSSFSGRLSFLKSRQDAPPAIFAPGKKGTWERQSSPDSSNQLAIDILEGGSFFALLDDTPPRIKAQEAYATVTRGERLVFNIDDNTGRIFYSRTGITATLDGSLFFPDYNPLRHELSFRVPRRLGSGQHIFEFSIGDESGNISEFKHQFWVKS